MKTQSALFNTATWLCLFICTSAYAITGPETAQLLNNRYESATTTCANSKPAWYCNGVLVQARTRPAGQMFWQHDADATALGAEGFVYLRNDLGIRQLTQANGVIFSDLFTAVGDGKSLEVLCAYPFAPGLESSRSDYGCAMPVTGRQAAGDVSSCSALGVTDASTWLAHFQQQDNQPTQQCSLSSLDPLQFSASLKAHEGLGAEWSPRTNQLQVRNWDPTAPQSIPVQALFYDNNQSGALAAAQQDQRDYFNATGQWLPVVRMDLHDNSGKVFGFNLQDQLYVGYEVASRLNARYQNTSTLCGDKAAYFCNGILIRAADASASFHAWDPSPNSVSRNGVSFSYLRSDVGTTVIASTHGFIMKESFAPTAHPITLRCAYPSNASTAYIPDSCRASCEQQGIVTVEGWRAKYASSPGSSCAFTASPAQFQLNVEVRTTLSATEKAKWNELIIAAWPQNIPTQIPLEAFFYTTPTSLAHAQFIQRDYFAVTGRFLPLTKLTLADAQPFTYTPADQLSAGAPGLRNREVEDQALDLPTRQRELLPSQPQAHPF